MKRIRIFLASSITDLRLDRIEIGNFFRQLNDVYIESGVYFDLAMCEDYDNGVALDGKQLELDRLICDSELIFFVFFKKVGDFTRHEFEIALESYKSCKRPKIITYFKCVNSVEEATEDVKGFMQMLDTELRHYYNIYKEIDTLKLGMFMQIKLMRLDETELKIDNGRLMHGNTQIAETKNIPMFECNEKLNRLKNQLSEADKKYISAKVAFLKNGTDEEYLAFSDAASEKEKAEKALKDLENAILNVAEKMYEKTTDTGALSQKQIQAYRHMERGEWDLALAILDKSDILSELSHNESLEGGIRERIKTNASELLQRIEVLKAAGLDKDSIEEIRSLYSIIYDITIKHNLDLKPICEYASFLHTLNLDKEALAIAKKLAYFYADPDRQADIVERAELLFLQGKIYNGLKEYDKTIALIQNDIDIPQRLYSKEGERICVLCGDILNILANALYYQKRYDDVLKYQAEALKYYEKAYAYDPKKNKERLAMINDNCGSTFEIYKELDKALSYHKKAEKMYYELLESNTEKSKKDLSRCYHNTALCYKQLNDFDKCEQYFLEAIKIREEIRQKNPSTIEPHLSGSYYSLGWLYKVEKRNAQGARKALEACKSIRARLRKRSIAYANELKYAYIAITYDSRDIYTSEEKNKYTREYVELLNSLPELTLSEKEELCYEGFTCAYRDVCDNKDISLNELENTLAFLKKLIDIYIEDGNKEWDFNPEHALFVMKNAAKRLDRMQDYNEYKAKLDKKHS